MSKGHGVALLPIFPLPYLTSSLAHLIDTGPKLEGNTLHSKASFLECTSIL